MSEWLWELQWDDENVEHVARYGVREEEVEEVVFDGATMTGRTPHPLRTLFIGLSDAGRFLLVVVARIGEHEGRVINGPRCQPERARRLQELEARPMTEGAKQVPEFASEAEEREFWDSGDATDVVPQGQWERSGARRSPTTTFAIRLDQADIERIRQLARARGIGPTQLARSWLLDRLRLEQAVGELANPEADEEEIQIRRKVMDDLAEGIPPIVLGALAAFGIGTAIGQAISKNKRAAAGAEQAGGAERAEIA